MRWWVVILVVCLAHRPARADDEVGYGTAHLLALGGTALIVPPLLCISETESASTRRTCRYLAAGVVLVGPSIGRWYARDQTITGVLVRGAGLGLAVALAKDSDGEGDALIGLGLLAVAVGALYDLGKTSCSVNEHNARSITVVPAAGANPGLSLVGTF